MKSIKWLWILMSLGLWLILAAFAASFLIKQRALSSINELKSADTPYSAMQTSVVLANIRTSLHISHVLHGRGISYSPEWLASLGAVLEKITTSGTLPDEKHYFTCAECTPAMQSNLKIVATLAREGKIKEKAYERALEMQEKYKDEKKLQIKLHIMLAEDFAELLGSVSLYKSKGESELIYYKDGPFKGLPLLDNSARAGSTESSWAVEDFSQKIEILKSQSLLIIQNYQKAASKLEESLQAISLFEREITEIRLKIKVLLLDGLREELNAE